MPGYIAQGLKKGTGKDCVTAGFPIHFRETYEVAEGTDTDAAPLIPGAAFLGVMNGLTIANTSCQELTATIEFWSANSDCDGCTTDAPTTATQDFTLKKGEALNFEGYVVDYSIVGGTFIQDGCVDVMTSRTPSTCCLMTGVTTATNGLIVPTI